MPNAAVALQVLPGVSGKEEIIRVVDAVIAEIAASGLPYEVGPFETTVEGDLDVLMALVTRCVKLCITQGAPSVISYLKINHAPEGVWSTDEKVTKHRG